MSIQRSLSGLILVFIGLLIEIYTAFFGNFSSINPAWGSVSQWIGVGGIVISIIGLSQLARVNLNFAKSRLFYVIDVAISVAAAIILSIMAGAGAYVAFLIVSIIVLIALFVIDLLKVKTLMYGCADVANDNNDRAYAHSCVNAWRNFLIATIIKTALGIIMFIVGAITAGVVASTGDPGAVGVGLIIILLITLGAAIYEVVARIMVLLKTIGTYSRYNNRRISSFEGKTSDVFNDMKDDHRDLFGDAKDSFGNMGGTVKDGFSDMKDDIGDIKDRRAGDDDIFDDDDDARGRTPRAGSGARRVGEAARDGAANAGRTVRDGAANVGGTVKDGAGKVGGAVAGGAAAAGGAVAGGAAKTGAAMKEGLSGLGGKFGGLGGKIKDGAGKVGGTMKDGVGKVGEGAGKVGGAMKDGVGKVGEGAGKVGGAMKDGVGKVGEGAGKVGGAMKDGVGKVGEGAGLVGNAVKDGAVKTGETIKDGTIKAGEKISGKSEQVTDDISDFTDGE